MLSACSPSKPYFALIAQTIAYNPVENSALIRARCYGSNAYPLEKATQHLNCAHGPSMFIGWLFECYSCNSSRRSSTRSKLKNRGTYATLEAISLSCWVCHSLYLCCSELGGQNSHQAAFQLW